MFHINQKKKKKSKKGEKTKLIGKRDPKDKVDLPEYSAPEKKMVGSSQGNILDDLVKEGYNEKLYKSLFHKEHEVEDAEGLIFRNVRFGIR